MNNNRKTYKYSVDQEDFENSYEFESTWIYDGMEDVVVEEAAEDYHDNHDGYEDSWPIDFFLFDLNGTLLESFTVEREASPVFNAYLRKEKKV